MFNKIIKLKEKELDAELSLAYLDGYIKGYQAGKTDGILEKTTPNQLREFLGLKPIGKTE